MNPDDIAKILDDLGQRLGPAGQHVFQVAIQQVYVDSTLIGILTIGVIIATILLFRYTKKVYGPQTIDDKISTAMLGFVIGVFEVGFLIITIKPMFNPEWSAIQRILDSIR